MEVWEALEYEFGQHTRSARLAALLFILFQHKTMGLLEKKCTFNADGDTPFFCFISNHRGESRSSVPLMASDDIILAQL